MAKHLLQYHDDKTGRERWRVVDQNGAPCAIDRSFATKGIGPLIRMGLFFASGTNGDYLSLTDQGDATCRDFERHKAQHAEWAARGMAERETLDQVLRDCQTTLDMAALARIQLLVDGVTDRAETTAHDYVRFVKSLRKNARKIVHYSKPTGRSLDQWIVKAERHLEGEIDFLTETADHYAAMRAAYSPDRQASDPFETADAVLDFLKRPT